MKKLIVLTAILTMAGRYSLVAQNDSTEIPKPRTSGHISFLIGGSIPVGQFADPNIGGADDGVVSGVSFALPLKNSNFGIAAIIESATLDQTGKPFMNKQKEITARNSAVLAPIGYKIDSISQYRQFNIVFGGYYTKPITKRMTFDGRVLIGLNRIVKDELAVKITNLSTGYVGYVYSGGGASNNACLDLGASFRLNLGKRQHFNIALNVDYIAAKANFTVKSYGFYEQGGNLYLDYFNENINHAVSAINIGVSGGFVFIKKEKK